MGVSVPFRRTLVNDRPVTLDPGGSIMIRSNKQHMRQLDFISSTLLVKTYYLNEDLDLVHSKYPDIGTASSSLFSGLISDAKPIQAATETAQTYLETYG